MANLLARGRCVHGPLSKVKFFLLFFLAVMFSTDLVLWIGIWDWIAFSLFGLKLDQFKKTQYASDFYSAICADMGRLDPGEFGVQNTETAKHYDSETLFDLGSVAPAVAEEC